MSLNINSLEIFFTSEVFGGSLTVIKFISNTFSNFAKRFFIQLNQFRVASCTPFWKTATDLRQTRIREPNLNQALLFKQVSWQLLRIEASTLGDSIATGYNINAPLRLITSQGRARITVKKSTVGKNNIFCCVHCVHKVSIKCPLFHLLFHQILIHFFCFISRRFGAHGSYANYFGRFTLGCNVASSSIGD